jgi:CHAT domain-containing protein/Tfp pilus assembly protein PilF
MYRCELTMLSGYMKKTINAFIVVFALVVVFTGRGYSADSMESAEMLVSRASKQYLEGNFLEATRLTRKAVDIVTSLKGTNSLDTAAYLAVLATFLTTADELEEAENVSRKALKIRENALGQNDPETIMSYTSLGQILRIKEDYSSAEESLKKALSAQRKLKRKANDELGIILKELGYVLAQQGLYREAQGVLDEALSVFEKTKNGEGQAAALSGLVYVLSEKGDRSSAIAISRKQLAITEKTYGVNDFQVSGPLNDLGVLLTEIGDLAEAEPLLRRALALREGSVGSTSSETAATMDNLAVLLGERGQLKEAEQLSRRALEIREELFGDDSLNTARSINNLATLLMEEEGYDEAELLLQRSLLINERKVGSQHPYTATSLNNLAHLLERKQDYDGAEPLFRRALAIRAKAFGPENADTAESLNQLAGVLNSKKSYREALDLARAASKSGYPSRSAYITALWSSELSFATTLGESFTVVQSTMNSEAGSALASLSARFGSGDTELAVLVREEQDMNARIASLDKAYLEGISKPAAERNKKREQALQEEINKLKEKLGSVRTRLGADFPNYAELQKPRPLELAEAQSLLKEDEALVIIDTVKDGEGDYAWAVTSTDAAWQKLETTKGEIDELVALLLPALNPDNEAEVDLAKAHRLYQLTLGTLEKQSSGKKHLIFVLNGAMTSLPPHLLVTRDHAGKTLRDVDWLIKKYAVTVLPTVSSLKLLRGSPAGAAAPRPMRGYADVAYAPRGKGGDLEVASRSVGELFVGGVANTRTLQGASPLPATGPEARAVMQVLGGNERDIITGRKASEKEIKNANLFDYRVLYFATHGLLAGEVEELAKLKAEPALLFAVPEKPTAADDGLLTASEVAQLKLNADWAVLSACNTAAGGKPGAAALSGLARAFFYAGARSLLVSHWPVEDEATKALMVRLFEAVKANPDMRAAEAQQKAMLSVMNDQSNPQWSNPAYWAPFILVGEPRR